MKEKADKGRKTNDTQVNDVVLVKQKKRNNFTSRFDSVPFQVVRKKGTMVMAQSNGKYISRNASHFKWVNSSLLTHHTQEEEDDPLNSDTPTSQPTHDSPHVSPTVKLLRCEKPSSTTSTVMDKDLIFYLK